MSEAGGGALSATLNALFGAAGNSSSNNNSQNSVSRSLSTTASMGISLIIIRIVASAVQAAREDLANSTGGHNNNTQGGDAVTHMLHRGESVLQFLRSFLHRMIVQRQNTITNGTNNNNKQDDDDDDEDNVPVIHEGSCHCQSVHFELIAPQKILCKLGEAAKIQFRHIRVRAKSFRILKGAHLVKMYYVNKPSSVSPQALDTGAHSFCSRCGVHFLHAPNSRSTALDVNVDCLHLDGPIKVCGKTTNLSVGVPVPDQWDQAETDGLSSYSNRYPATIAEETLPMMMMFPTTAESTPSPSFASYQNNHHMARNSHNSSAWDSFDNKSGSNSTIDLVFPASSAGTKMMPPPPTPTTVYTSNTESFYTAGGQPNHTGVPPTLTWDTRDCTNDAESVISLSSAKAFPALRTGLDSFGGGAAVDPMGSPPSNAAISPSTTPLVRHQLNFYMRKHMSSSSSVGSSSSMISPRNSTVQKSTTKRDFVASSNEGGEQHQQQEDVSS
ncbi:Glutathione-dependent formaldehyde-activating enzyme [Seminavis robusta]|uniref:Glutathione-dependent formaldehyde-activating enzyme n=1 Tax=Seminavis robusta TaxID=568900 RepID=A0A9N8HIQ9_9STRA|nr:Glutathione-dependent formaldehyde-activating enzyme [Seminavis robusta]|eukprot:Sro714_g191700.1 Glutathione-dependent formaldehyde-activating enzyme (499) ;mRNA; r:24029-25625